MKTCQTAQVRALAAAIVFGTGAACAPSTPSTQLQTTVNVEQDLQIPAVKVIVTATGRPTLMKTFMLPQSSGTRAAIEWQILIPTASRPFVATIEASGTSNGKDVADDVAVWINPGRKATATLSLARDCLGVVCPAGQTCGGGACNNIAVIGAPDEGTDAALEGPRNDVTGETIASDDAYPGAQDSAGQDSIGQDAPNNQPCTTDLDCPKSFHCTALHVCVPTITTGTPCTTGGECQSTFCVGGVCCDQACGDLCKACTSALTGNVDGMCDLVLRGAKEPQSRCPNAGNTTCGNTGNCDGKGACELPGSAVVCTPAACNAGSFTTAGTCTNGACEQGAVMNCGTSMCSATTGCATKCTTDSDCPGGYCSSATTCAVKKIDGQACAGSNECLANHTCVGNAAGTAKVCCNTACAATCMSCFGKDTGSTDGSCLATKLGGSSNGQCPNDNAPPCGHPGTCDGKGACFTPPNGTSCGNTMCSGSLLTSARTCDGKGVCQAAPSGACPGALVCGSMSACKTSCGSDADCVTGYCAANGVCTARQGDGTGCTSSDMCANSNCASGLCCPNGDKRCGNACIPNAGCCAVSECTAVCTTCTNNSCLPVKNADDPDSCAGSCDANGVCKGKQGQACPANGCLAGLSCAENVCCNGSCGTKCNSCLGANTGLATGTCGPVSPGLAHGTDCAATGSTTCGTTGKCNGGGGCSFWPAGTSVAPASCPPGGTSLQPASTCNGSGGIASPPPMSCGAYQCNGGAAICKSGACSSTSTDCSAGNYCSSNGCVATKGSGQLCAASSECTSTVCGIPNPAGCVNNDCGGSGGRCCAAGKPCVCPQPTAGEIVANAGFDSGLGSWTAVPTMPGDMSIAWSAHDADGCPFSGAVKFLVQPNSVSPSISQCVAVTAGQNYQFGVAAYNGDLDPSGYPGCNNVDCNLMWYTGDGVTQCANNISTRAFPDILLTNSNSWTDVPNSNLAVTAPAGATAARISCGTGGTFGPNPCAAFVDRAYLTPGTSIY